MAIADLRMESAQNGEKFDKNYVVENLPKRLEDCSCRLEEDGQKIEGEYKDYIFIIREDFVAEIESKVGGIRPEMEVEVLTEEYVTEGNAIEIQVTVTIAEGTATLIAPQDAILSNTTQIENGKVYVYSVNKNGNYTFTAIGDSGRKRIKTIEIKKVIERPEIEITDVTMGSIKVNIVSKMENVTYNYYVNDELKVENIVDKTYIIEDLNSSTKYTVKVGMNYNGTELMSETKEITTKAIRLSDAKDFWKLTDGIENSIENSLASELIAVGEDGIEFDEEGMKITGSAYLRTEGNYEFPTNFSMLIQVKTSEFEPVGRKWTYGKNSCYRKIIESTYRMAF